MSLTLTIGQRLHMARESKGLSLQDIAHQTRIPVPRLRDLEEDTYTTFGSLTYARTFLKDYSHLMGVDAHEVLEEMHAPPLGGTASYKYLMQNYGTWTRNRNRPTSFRDNAPVMAKGRSMGLVAGICGAVLLIGMGMLLGAAIVGDRKPVAQVPTEPAMEVRVGRPAPLPETQAASFAVPQARPVVEEDRTPPPAGKPQITPGVIPKALPVDAPKAAKSHR